MKENNIDYRLEEEEKRVAAYDKRKEVGECTFSTDNSKFWTIDHTYVEPEYRGERVAGNLVKKVVEAAKEKNVKLVPVCRFACREFDRKPEYEEVWYKGNQA
jgi:predicted GNAT family acetyltransferase